MESIDDWAIKLAEATAPNEVDLAPFIVEAFVAGGESRASLFQQSGRNVAGGLGGGGTISILAWILRGIVASAKWLSIMLTTEGTSNFLAVVKESLGLVREVSPKQRFASMPNDPYEPLKLTIEILSTELRASGLPSDRADAITLRVVQSLLEEPTSAALFVRQLESKR